MSLAVISIGVNIYLGQLNNSKDNAIQRQQTEPDSLRQILAGQQHAIDSLTTISTARPDTIQ